MSNNLPPLGGPDTGPNKAIAAGVGGALAVVLTYIVDQLIPHPLPPEIVAAVQTIVVTGLVWLVPHKFGE